MMENRPLVSIIIPCYNSESYIEETIHSVLESTYRNIEIIIVNDGSTDNSELIVRNISATHSNIFLLSQVNSGPAAARNNGIKNAKGEYILPLDADDLIGNEYLEKAVDVLAKNEHIKIVYCEAEFFGERCGKWNLPSFRIEKLAIDNMIFCSALYRKKDWLQAGGYDERMTWGWEDWEFWISMLKNGGDAYRLPFVGFKYRVRKNSRRKSTNKAAKKRTIALINEKHPEFVFRYLKGPLRYQRSMSKLLNSLRMGLK